MRISSHWPPIHWSYRLKKPPLPHFHHRVEPPMASELLSQTEKPPVYIAPACGGPSNWNWRFATMEPMRL